MNDMDEAIVELGLLACNEINFGTSSTSRTHAFQVIITSLYSLSTAAKELSRLGQTGGLLTCAADKVFHG